MSPIINGKSKNLNCDVQCGDFIIQINVVLFVLVSFDSRDIPLRDVPFFYSDSLWFTFADRYIS